MAHKEDAETLSVDINREVFAVFQQQYKERGQVRNKAVEAAIKFWIELPTDMQARLLDRSLNADNFIELVHEIVDARIAKGYADGEKFLAKRRKNKRSRKG